ncbi:MAG: S-methyl-5-thioribose-phosphate isomerase [Myxococcales bacterium]|nr:S-methyl-5-thioribose-phosphate isomerase [Myxococcales bacterium]
MAPVSLPPGQRPPEHADVLSPIFWRGDAVVVLDQRRLPHEEVWTAYDTWEDLCRAISDMEVRGAPAIGCAAAFATALAWRANPSVFALRAAMKAIGASRPTAVNLGAAVHRIANAITGERDPLDEARAFWDEDLAACRAIGAHGAALVPDGAVVLTHCNAGALATAGYGTALGIVRAAVAAGKKVRVLAGETRPWLQGARLTAWELAQDGIPCEVIVDGAAAHFLSRGDVQLAIVGADRIARNGDVANKIGTAGVAAACHAFGVPFVVAAPRTTLDPALETGAKIVLEERGPEEVTHVRGVPTVAPGTAVRNPVFDVTPARFVTAIVTDEGVARPPFAFIV